MLLVFDYSIYLQYIIFLITNNQFFKAQCLKLQGHKNKLVPVQKVTQKWTSPNRAGVAEPPFSFNFFLVLLFFTVKAVLAKANLIKKWSCRREPLLGMRDLILRTKLWKAFLNISFFYQCMPRLLLLWENLVFYKWSCRQEPTFCAECFFGLQLCLWPAATLHCTIVHYLASVMSTKPL